LGIDVGTAFTKAALFEPVDGRYRLIARAQAHTSASSHVYEGLGKACAQIEGLTGRQLFAGGEPLAGEVSAGRGVEGVAVAVSCYRPLQVLATNEEAAAATRSERCQVHVLAGSSVRERVQQATAVVWDAIVGAEAETEAALLYLGTPPAGPAAISGDATAIRRGLAELAIKLAEEQVAGLADLGAAATEPLATSSSALLELTQLIGSRFGLRLAIADCGSSQTTLTHATPNQGGARVVLHDHALLDVPTTHNGLSAMHEALQRALAGCVAEPFSADLVVGTGALTRFGRWGEPALTLLNGIRPGGVLQFALDSAGIVSQIAALARAFPDEACQAFEHDGLVALGAAVCPRGNVKPGAKALEIGWRIDDQPEQLQEVKSGELVRIPLAPGRKASLTLRPARQVDVGLNQPGVAATAHIDGGRVGLMVDARDEAAKAERRPWEEALA